MLLFFVLAQQVRYVYKSDTVHNNLYKLFALCVLIKNEFKNNYYVIILHHFLNVQLPATLQVFTWAKLCDALEMRAPILHFLLTACATVK